MFQHESIAPRTKEDDPESDTCLAVTSARERQDFPPLGSICDSERVLAAIEVDGRGQGIDSNHRLRAAGGRSVSLCRTPSDVPEDGGSSRPGVRSRHPLPRVLASDCNVRLVAPRSICLRWWRERRDGC